MNFFKKMLGYSTSLKQQIKNEKFKGTLYRVVKDTRNIIIKSCCISFEVAQQRQFTIVFEGFTTQQQNRQYQFPIHQQMDLVCFQMNKGGVDNVCFEWCLDQNKQHIGCYMDPSQKDRFKELFCKIIKVIMNDDLIKDHLKLCRQLSGIPVYKSNSSKISSSSNSQVSMKSIQKQINDILIKQSSRKQNKLVNSAKVFQIVDKKKKVINEAAVFVIRQIEKFNYEFQIINATGYTFIRKTISPQMVYQVNTQQSILKWLNIEESRDSSIVQVSFDHKADVAMSVKFAIQQCLYETNTRRKITDAITQDQLNYLKKLDNQDQKYEPLNKPVIKQYKTNVQIQQITKQAFLYRTKEAQKGLEKYRVLRQSKNNTFNLASLGSMIQTLKIQDNNHVEQLAKRKIPYYNGQQIKADNLILGDKDTKAIVKDEIGTLHYYDIQTGKIVNSYELCQTGIKDICHEFKLLESDDFKTYKAISSNSIYEVDPRIKTGCENVKQYKTNPFFNRICVDQEGRFACSSENGEIRLYNEIGKNANCKYPGLGDPVKHLESTKDGKWLLATYSKYLLVLPTQTQDGINLYQKKIKIEKRPDPVKLNIKLEHIQMINAQNAQFSPAKFDESPNKQIFIITSLANCVFVWNFSQVIKGQKYNYKFTTASDKIIEADFKYKNHKRLLLTTQKGIQIKENKTRI